MGYAIGIDLGTSNSVASVWRGGRVITIPIDGEPLMSSAISLLPDGNFLVGGSAKARSATFPAASVTSAKRMIGDGKTTYALGGAIYSPTDVSAMLLRHIKEEAERFLKQPVTEAVITVPAYFNNNQKQETKRAGEQAGLQVLQLLTEPTAAAISYGLEREADQTLLVYDLGGGTFDVSILQVRRNRFEEIAVAGDPLLGGDDFDHALVDHLLTRIEKRSPGPVGALRRLLESGSWGTAPTDLLRARHRLMEAAEKAKRDLSDPAVSMTRVILPEILETSLNEEVTLADYNAVIGPLVERTVDKIAAVLRAADMTREDISRVILVGGSTRNKLVKERVKATIKDPFTSDHVDLAVSQGAAAMAGYLSLMEDDARPVPIEGVSTVTAFDLGVRATIAGDPDGFSVLIKRNTSLPYAVEEVFTTATNNQQAVEVAVFQGEERQCSRNVFIGGFHLKGIPPAKAGTLPITVRFEMNQSDILAVSASCNDLRGEKVLDVNLVSRVEELSATTNAEADILFFVDTSGSMGREIEGVKKLCLSFAKNVVDAGVACRLGVVDFDKTSGGGYKWEVFGPMQPDKVPGAIRGLKIGRLGGCGCYIGESDAEPAVAAFVKAFPDPQRLKIGILISDEVGNDKTSIKRTEQMLKDGGVCLYSIGVKNSCHERLAEATGGRFWDIQAHGRADLSTVLQAIAVEITSIAAR